jgi:hypothetical protein
MSLRCLTRISGSHLTDRAAVHAMVLRAKLVLEDVGPMDNAIITETVFISNFCRR